MKRKLFLVFLIGAFPCRAMAQGRLTGIVTDAGSLPIAGASLLALAEGRGGALRAITDGNGRYAVVNIPAGSYTVLARIVGFRPASRIIEVRDGAETRADLVLEAAPISLAAPDPSICRRELGVLSLSP